MSFKIHPGFLSVFVIIAVSYILYNIVVPSRAEITSQSQDSPSEFLLKKSGINEVYESSILINDGILKVSFPDDWKSEEIQESQLVGEIPDTDQGWSLKSDKGLDFLEIFLVQVKEDSQVLELLNCTTSVSQQCKTIEIDTQKFTVISVDETFGSISTLATESNGFIYLIIASDFDKTGTVPSILSSIEFKN